MYQKLLKLVSSFIFWEFAVSMVMIVGLVFFGGKLQNHLEFRVRLSYIITLSFFTYIFMSSTIQLVNDLKKPSVK